MPRPDYPQLVYEAMRDLLTDPYFRERAHAATYATHDNFVAAHAHYECIALAEQVRDEVARRARRV